MKTQRSIMGNTSVLNFPLNNYLVLYIRYRCFKKFLASLRGNRMLFDCIVLQAEK